MALPQRGFTPQREGKKVQKWLLIVYNYKMYEKHFSFKYKPFELVPDPDFLFLSSTHKKASSYLDYGIKGKIGFILITGEIGSGKTTIIRNFIKNLSSSIKLSRINNTKVSSEQLISMINEDFGLDIEGKSKTKLLSELNEFLVEQYAKKLQPILLIDEAQNLSSELLEEIRLLSNLETDRSKMLQIVLIGQPELKKTLMLPELTQLRQRININYHIASLSFDETARYIQHRLAIAGNPDAIKFDDDMQNLIYQFSRGIPRLINILCDFALLSAYVEGRNEVNVDIVREVIHDLESHDYWSESKDTSVSETVKNDKDPDLSETVGDIALRIIKLEEIISNSLPEFGSLAERVKGLEEKILKVNEVGEDNKIDNLLERLEEKIVCRILTEVAEDNKITDKKSLDEQVEVLKKMLSDVNERLKQSCKVKLK